jgi:hypothetical protein
MNISSKNTENHDPKSGEQIFEDWKLEEWRNKRIFDLKFAQIMKEVFVFFVFLVLLYLVSFANLSNTAINYHKLFIKTYMQKQNLNEIGLDQVIK